ncbi:hypothetical protein CPB83DRAFT_924845 [Crepidotus variabilis]|uniref:Uncharacterized protein n=1 Tax=Crepidotus variabilis TaxID=179855 RepID=A0A9P6EUA0_9AGAR|nr:hypothetical protein CPB83DRAFT_924845 [Crepidotus variabilis]
MKDWNTISETLRDYQILVKMVHVLFGIYVWEFLTSMDFEWDFITGKKKFKWPFAAAISMPDYLYSCLYIWSNSSADDEHKSGDSNCTSSIAIWSNIFVTAGLTLMILGNAVVIILGCITSNPDETASWIRAALLYAMTLDFVVLTLSVYKITVSASPISQHILKTGIKPRVPQSKLIQILFKHGMIYYLTAFLTDLLSVIFLSLRLNDAMNEMAIPPTQIISTIAACRAVRALANFKQDNSRKPALPYLLTRMNLRSSKTCLTSISKASTAADMRTKELDSSFVLVEVETVTRRDLIDSN